MSTYNPSIVTEAGLALIAKEMAGQVEGIDITRIVTDDSDYSTVEDVTALEQPLHERHSFLISSKHVVNQKTVFLRTVITNKDIYDAGYRIGALCVLAEDPDKGEILYAIATAQKDRGDYFDAYNGYMPTTITVDLFIEVCNANSVVINGGAYGPASSEDLDELARRLNELEISSKPLTGSGVPTKETEGNLGQYYFDNDSQLFFICAGAGSEGYIWMPVYESRTFIVEITIPAESWTLDESLIPDPETDGTMPVYPYYADVVVEQAQAVHFPSAALHKEALEVASTAGVAPVMQALDGKVRFWAKEPAREALNVSLVLLSSGKESAGGGYGIVNVGNTLRINVPGGVAGVGEDGKIPESLIPDMGGFVEMTQNIPPVARQDRTLYGEVKFDFTGTSPAQLGLEV